MDGEDHAQAASRRDREAERTVMDAGVASERRTAENQALFRSVNDRIKQLNEAFEAFSPYGDWTCECMDIQCVEIVQMTLAEYDGVRTHADRFLVAPADRHVLPDVEQIIERTDRFWLVEKLGAAAERAAELDPRA
jgi:hypothetical protein